MNLNEIAKIIEGMLFVAGEGVEIDVFKTHRPVLDFFQAVFGADDIRFFRQDFGNTARRFQRHRKHNEDHREHHKTGQHLDSVRNQRRKIPFAEPVEIRPMGFVNDCVRRERRNQNRRKVDKEGHNGRGKRNNLFRTREIVAYFSCRFFKLLLFVFFSHERFNDPNPPYVLLHGRIQRVVLFENTAEIRHYVKHRSENRHAEQRYDRQENPSEFGVDGKAHNDCKNKLQRYADNDTQTHLIGLLYVRDVRRQTGDEGGGGKFIHVGKRKFLHSVKEVVPKIFCKSATRRRSKSPCKRTTRQREYGKPQQHSAVDKDLRHRLFGRNPLYIDF